MRNPNQIGGNADETSRRVGQYPARAAFVLKSRESPDDESNWELSCQKCNASKGRLSADEFFERLTSARVFREWLAGRELQTA